MAWYGNYKCRNSRAKGEEIIMIQKDWVCIGWWVLNLTNAFFWRWWCVKTPKFAWIDFVCNSLIKLGLLEAKCSNVLHMFSLPLEESCCAPAKNWSGTFSLFSKWLGKNMQFTYFCPIIVRSTSIKFNLVLRIISRADCGNFSLFR